MIMSLPCDVKKHFASSIKSKQGPIFSGIHSDRSVQAVSVLGLSAQQLQRVYCWQVYENELIWFGLRDGE
jgi:hypothetical protein